MLSTSIFEVSGFPSTTSSFTAPIGKYFYFKVLKTLDETNLTRASIQRQNAQDLSLSRISTDTFSPTFNPELDYYSKMSPNLPFCITEQQELDKSSIVGSFSHSKIISEESEIFSSKSTNYLNRQQILETNILSNPSSGLKL